MIRRSRSIVLLGVIACLVVVSGCSSQSGVSRADGDTSYVAGDGTTVILPEAQRQPAPAIVASTLKAGRFDGSTFDLAAQRGKVVVLNVWASWCAPCRAEAPSLARVSKALSSNGVVFAGLNTRDSGTSAQSFVDHFDVPYLTLDDTDGRLQLAFRNSLPMTAIPSTIVIDKQGRVAARALGELDESRVRGLVEPLLRESAG